MISKEKVLSLINEKIEGTDHKFFLVDLKISGNNKISVEIDHEEKPVSIDDCVQFSRQVEHNLDREQEDFELEVASAGLSNPFKVVKQYKKNVGKEVNVLLHDSKSLKGKLTYADEEKIKIKYDIKETIEGKKKKQTTTIEEEILLNAINQTKLIITFK